jgi:hypothetical protein
MADEVQEVSDAILVLGLQVIELLAEQQRAGGHARTREAYSQALQSHDKFLRQITGLGKEADLTRAQAASAEFMQRVEAVLEKQRQVDVMSLADDEVLALCNRAWETMESMPHVVDVAVASTAISHFALIHSHAEVLNAFLDRPPLDRKILDGVTQLAKAAALDLGGNVFPFIGTLETLFELATPQIKRDSESMRNASAMLDRLFVFGDQLSLLSKGADVAEANARIANQVISQANLDFERESRLLIRILEDNAEG